MRISPRTIAKIRQAVVRTLPDRVTVIRMTDADGYMAATEIGRVLRVPCRVAIGERIVEQADGRRVTCQGQIEFAGTPLSFGSIQDMPAVNDLIVFHDVTYRLAQVKPSRIQGEIVRLIGDLDQG